MENRDNISSIHAARDSKFRELRNMNVRIQTKRQEEPIIGETILDADPESRRQRHAEEISQGLGIPHMPKPLRQGEVAFLPGKIKARKR